MKKFVWILMGILLLGLAAAGGYLLLHQGGGPGLEAAVVRIGAIVPLTGPLAAFGEPVRDGMLMAMEEINTSGGIEGKPIKLIIEDDASDPKTAVNAFTKLATVDKVPIILGPLSSGSSMATAPLADKYHVVQVSTLAGTIDLTHAGDYVFRIYPSSEVGSRYIAKVAVQRFKARRVAILYPTNAFGVTSRKFVTEDMKNSGAQVVVVETFNDGDRDFRTQLTKVAQAKPDLIICSAYYTEGAQILVQAKQLGLKVPILGEDGWFGPIADIAGDALKNLYFANTAFGPEYQNNQVMQKFIRDFQKKFGKKATSYSATGYDAVYLAKKAVDKGGYDGTGIKTALYQIDFQGAFGKIKFDENGDNIGAIYDLFQLSGQNDPIRVRDIQPVKSNEEQSYVPQKSTKPK